MPWFFYSILSSLGFVGMILCVRKLMNDGFAPKQILMFLTGLVSLAFGLANVFDPGLLWQSQDLWPFLFLMGGIGFFHVVGNWADFTGIQRAPNPGYVVAIRNATILPIVFLAPFLFASPVASGAQWVAVFAIIGGITLVAYERKRKEAQNSKSLPWPALAFLALGCFMIGVLIMKQVTLFPYASAKEIVFLASGINCIAFALMSGKESARILGDPALRVKFLFFIVLAAIFSALANWGSVTGLTLAPNPGYHNALQNTHAALVALVAIPMFGSEWNARKMAGVALVIIGTIMLILLA